MLHGVAALCCPSTTPDCELLNRTEVNPSASVVLRTHTRVLLVLIFGLPRLYFGWGFEDPRHKSCWPHAREFMPRGGVSRRADRNRCKTALFAAIPVKRCPGAIAYSPGPAEPEGATDFADHPPNTGRVIYRYIEAGKMNYNAFFATALRRLQEEQRYRVFVDLERIAGRFPHAIWHSPAGSREVVIWCSNDYLGMGQHPKVIGAMVAAVACFGAGAGGTRNIAGTNHPLVELEHELADLHRKEAALVFSSGYVSNQTGIATIAKLIPDCLILSDALNHNSMIEGVRQSGCEKRIWRHNDARHLEELLQAAGTQRPKLIVFETLYSMDGDVAPVHPICDLAE